MEKNKTSDQKDQSIKAILSLIKRHKLRVMLIVSMFTIANIAQAILPYFVGQVAGVLSSSPVDSGELTFVLAVMLGATLVHDLFWRIGDFLFIYQVLPLNYKMRKLFLSTPWQYEYSKFIEKPSGKIAGSVIDAFNSMCDLINTTLYEYLDDLVKFPTLIVIVFLASPANAAVYAIFTFILVTANIYMARNVRRDSAYHADNQSSVNGRLYDSYSNFVNVKSFGAEAKESTSLGADNISLASTSIKKHLSITFYWTTASLIVRWILWPVILGLDLLLFRQGKLTVAQFVTSIAVLQQFTYSIWDLVSHIGSFSTKVAEYRQNYNYLFEGRNIVKEYHQGLDKPKSKVIVPDFRGEIKLNKLNFAYPDRLDNLVLKNISIDIKKNEKIGIVGKSGSGKSTLIKLLLGFYDYKEGSIQIDGKNIPKEELGLINSYVPQDTTLFQQSIAYNIAYAKEGKATKGEIMEAAKKAHAHEFIDSLPDKYDTLVGERGIKLSLGQRQRIAIARAFLKHSDLLILDEATSALDSKTEKLVQDSLEKLWEEKTVIAIAHRLSTLNNVDRIIVMDKGRIVEQGTKAELLSLGGIFAELWHHQKNGLLIEDEEESWD